MNKYFKFFTGALLLSAALLFLSCETPKYHITESPLLQKKEVNGIDVECLYLDKAAIMARHGKTENPFLPPSMVITPQSIIVFELKIKNLDTAAVKLSMRDVIFTYNNTEYKALSKAKIEDKIKEYAKNSKDRIKQERVAKGYMIGDIKTINGNSEFKGYVVFMGGFKDKGAGELKLYFTTPDGYDAGEMLFNYDFTLNRRR